MNKGIYLLANDNVYDQLVALLNSIEVNYSRHIPICIIPFDDNIELVVEETAKRENIFLFNNKNSIDKWETFINNFHDLYYNYPDQGLFKKRTEVLSMHRKYCAFDGCFDEFIYLDIDTLVFQSLDHVFTKLKEYDFVVHDFQRTTSIRLNEVSYFFEVFKEIYESENALSHRFHCGGFWASKRGVIDEKDLEYFLHELANGDIKIFQTWLSEQTKLNYMTLKKGLTLYNFTLDDSEYNTGVCITSPHFEEKNHILYDHGKKLTYLHYMGIKNKRLRKLCEWQKIKLPYKNKLIYIADKLFKWQIRSIPYKNIFLYYRFMDNPETVKEITKIC